VSDRLAVTCAHVVKEGCGVEPGDCVRVVFYASGQEREAEVLPEFWRPSERDDAQPHLLLDDVAILRLLPQDEPLPQGVAPAQPGSTRACNGHAMRVLGFPPLVSGYDVAWAEGELRGVVPHPDKRPMLQMDARPIYKGMSGAPVLDLATQCVVGVVCEYLPDAPLEWATTTETLQAICPDLRLHPPQAVQDYLAALREYCDNLPYLTLDDIRPSRTLDEVYVPLKARPQPRKEKRDKDLAGLPDLAGLDRGEPLSIAEVMRRRELPHALILGEPGAGKSTLLRQLAGRAWDAPDQIGLDAPYLPILVPLRRLAGAEGSLEARLNRALTTELTLAQDLPEGFFADWPRQIGARWLVLLDALDEVPTGERARLLQSLRGMLKGDEPGRIVITSRPSGYAQGELDDSRLAHYDLLPFTPDQTSEFAVKWFENKAGQFLKELERIRAGALSGTPLLLTIAVKVYLERGTLPERRSELYGQFVDIWLSEAEQRGMKAELGERICKVARHALGKLALAMTEHPDQADKATLSRIAAAYLRGALHLSEDEAEEDGKQFVDVMARRSGVFTRRGDAFNFIHPTFREYLAACAVVRESRRGGGYDLEQVWRRAVSRWADETWHEVALFALSLLSDGGQDVTALVSRVWRAEEGLYFAGAALAEQVKVAESLSDDIIDGLFTGARSGELWESWQALSILGELRSYPRAGVRLLMLARDENADEWGRVRAAEALGGLGWADEAAPILLALARDKKIDWKVRMHAVAALGRLGRADDLLALAHNEKVGASVCERATEALGELGRADDLLALARDEKVDWRVCESAAEALSRLGRADELLALARDEKVDRWLRESAAEALGELGRGDEAAQAWLALARDKKVDAWSRESAAEALGELGQTDEAAPILLALARDEEAHWLVRERAVAALGELGRADEAAPIWLALACDQKVNADVRKTAADVLGELGWAEEAAQAWLALACDEKVNADVRAKAAAALGELGRADEAAPILLALARGEKVDEWVRKRAIKSLRQSADTRALPVLEQIAQEDKSERVRRAAQRAIEQIRQRIE
jgi:HEAT repeat protein